MVKYIFVKLERTMPCMGIELSAILATLAGIVAYVFQLSLYTYFCFSRGMIGVTSIRSSNSNSPACQNGFFEGIFVFLLRLN